MCTQEERALGREIITFGVYRPMIFLKDGAKILELMKVYIRYSIF